ncbi:MAG: A/G-specific adenine glycosylase [Roseburia sp.]|nr:A/G-specific adenine glycosylase [Roseburia sp.]
MKYRNIVPAEFVDRVNRFIAHVKIDGSPETVHVKNTGRCDELLQPGVTVYLEKSGNPARSTDYDLVAVEKGDRLVNMDSQAPNKVAEEWLRKKELFPDLILLRPETKFGNSRFDFYIETTREKIFMEVKGVTREQDGIVCFPDAPSQRAIKHVRELIQAKEEGYRAILLFVVQMEGVRYFTPDVSRHAAFAKALQEAAARGVETLAYDCLVKEDGMTLYQPVPVSLDGKEPQSEGKSPVNRAGVDCSQKSENLKENFSLELLSAVPKPLLKWYDTNKRSLPWRTEPTPYRVWVSEIMLQQTRVEAVKPYFERFMRELPDICSLAYAKEEKLLKLWEGLGYYNRVRNLQKAALQIVEDYGGNMPESYEEILKLKGIGSYTAGAISSIAFGEPFPAVDGNVLRVLARLRQDERLISDMKVRKLVEQDLRKIMPMDRPGDFNQAMMELGACVCIPAGAPHCGECPLEGICMAHGKGKEQEYPKKSKSRDRKMEEKTVLVIRDENKIALHKRPSRGLLAGMYEFPTLEGYYTAEEALNFLADNGLKGIRITPLKEARHIFTHKEWHMIGYMVRVDELERSLPKEASRDWIYVELEETKRDYPIPSAFEAYMKYLR